MDRRRFLGGVGQWALCAWAAANVGCRNNNQVARVLNENDRDMVGSHTAGAETWEPLIQKSVGELLGRQASEIQAVSHDAASRKRICFVGLQNKGGEELGDFGEQIYEKIDTCINQSEMFEVINRHAVEAGLRECRLRPDDLYLPNHQRQFAATMETNGTPFDYLLYAKITTGTTKSNSKDYQRDYDLTLELVNTTNFHTDKVMQQLRKGYGKTNHGLKKHYG